MKNNKYILGCGISALIYKFYRPEFKIISPISGVDGKLKNDFMKNIVYLHDSDHTKKFLEDLDIKYTKKTQLIKYVKGNVVRGEITVLDKINYIRKKLDDDIFLPKDLNLSTNDYYISTLECDFNLLLDKLKENVEMIDDKVIRITDTEIITEKTRYEYEEIVSTIPAQDFWNIYHTNNHLDFKHKSVTFVLCDSQPSILDCVNYDLCYVIDNNKKYNRISKRDNNYLYEFTGEFSLEEIKKYLPKDAKVLNHYVDNYAIIYTNENNVEPKNIKFLGRFAKYVHYYKINDVIEEAQWSYDFQHIFNRQKSFSSKVLDFDKLKDVKEKEKQTQSFLLHLMEELGEILREINYKSHKSIKKVNVDNVKEEIIDMFKYVLNLCLVWDIDLKEFVRLFNEKSKICEDRLENENIN